MSENVTEVKGHFPFYRRFRKFGNGGEWNKYFSRKFPESPITVEFLTESSEKYASKVEKKENFRNEMFEILVYHTRLSSFWNFLKMPFHSLPEGLVEWKAPKSFLGLASYYQRFFPNYAQVAWPLHKLTEAHVDFASTSECQLSFDTLKTLMSTVQILQQSLCSTQTTPIIVWNCPKLGEGWGWSPVAYASQTLT